MTNSMTKNAGGCDMGLRWTMSMGRLIHVWFTLTKFDRRGVVWRSVKKFKWLSESLKRNQVDVTSIQKSALIVETTSSVLTSRCYFSPTVHLCVTSVQYFIPSAHFIHKVHLTPGASCSLWSPALFKTLLQRQHCYMYVQRSTSFFIFCRVMQLLPNMYLIYTINSCFSDLLSVKSSIWSSFRI